MKKYLQQSEDFFKEAEKEISKGNFVQASEKLWGAASLAVKAIAQERKWAHNGHAKLFAVVNRLVKETGDKEINSLFLVTNSLHMNFYENWLPSDTVIQAKNDVKKFIEKLKASVQSSAISDQ